MNPYDHEDAFKAANLYAGRVIDLPAGLKACSDMDQAKIMIASMQGDYQQIFAAFIEGVAYGRANKLPAESPSTPIKAD